MKNSQTPNVKKKSLPEAAAASVPSSLTSTNALCTTLLTYKLLALEMLVKFAFRVNIVWHPSYKKYIFIIKYLLLFHKSLTFCNVFSSSNDCSNLKLGNLTVTLYLDILFEISCNLIFEKLFSRFFKPSFSSGNKMIILKAWCYIKNIYNICILFIMTKFKKIYSLHMAIQEQQILNRYHDSIANL